MAYTESCQVIFGPGRLRTPARVRGGSKNTHPPARNNQTLHQKANPRKRELCGGRTGVELSKGERLASEKKIMPPSGDVNPVGARFKRNILPRRTYANRRIYELRVHAERLLALHPEAYEKQRPETRPVDV